MSDLTLALQARGWSWRRLGIEADVSHPVVYGIRDGNYRHVGMRAAERVARALHVPVTVVFPDWARAAQLATKDLDRFALSEDAKAWWWERFAQRSERPCPLDTLQRQDAVRLVRQAVTALPERLSGVFVMRWYHELSHIDIASVLGIPVGTSKSRLHDAMVRVSGELWDAAGR